MTKSKQGPTPVVYVDSNIYFDLLSRNITKQKDTQRPRWEIAKAVFEAVNEDRIVLAASALLEAEVNCLKVVRDGASKIHDQVRGWFTAPATRWTDVDRFLARDAAKLAQQYHQFAAPTKKFGGADATHLAAAVRLGCTHLMTHDEGFPLGKVVDGVQVIRPAEVWPLHLFDEIPDEAVAEEAPAKAEKAAQKRAPLAPSAKKAPAPVKASKPTTE